MTSQLSWQPPPVTKCGECPYEDMRYGYFSCEAAAENYKVHKQNKDGITTSCPMWQQQNKNHNKGEQNV